MPLISGIGFRVKNFLYSSILYWFIAGFAYSQRGAIIPWITERATGTLMEGIQGWQLNEWIPMFILSPIASFGAVFFYGFRSWNHNRKAPMDLTQNYLVLNENVVALRGKLEIYNTNLTNFMASTNAVLTKHGVEFQIEHDGASYVAHQSEAKRKKQAKDREKQAKVDADIEASLRTRATLIKANRTTATSDSTAKGEGDT